MRVLWLAHGYPPDGGGVARHGALLAPRLARAGVDVHVVALGGRDGVETRDGVTVHRMAMESAMQDGDGQGVLAARVRVGRLAADLEPDVVHLHLPTAAGALAATLPRLRGTPQVVSLHNELAPFSQQGPVAQALTGATVVTTIAGHLRDALVGVRPELATRVVAIGNAVDARPTTEPPPLPVVAFVGRLEHQKGLDVLLRALPSVLARHPELRTVVMGGGSQGAELRALSKRLGVDHAVTFVGHQPPEAVAALLDQCLVVAMPSRYEGLPYVAVEAAAAGRAVVGSRIPGLDEAVVDGTTGILVDPGEPAALAEAVAALAGNPEWCAAMGEAGHARLQLDADVGDAAAALQLVYRRAVERDEIPGLVSVIVPVRNGAAFIAEALASVRAQEGGLPTEVVVVDDGSTDDTAAVVARCDPAATVIRHCRGGPGPARNAGLALTTGEYVALLDADDRWPPGRLARLMGVLAAHADLEAVFGSAVEFGGSHDTVARPGVLPARMPTSGIIRRRAFDRVGGFRVGLIGGDAVDWMVRFLAIGQPIRIVDDVVLERRVHGRNTGRGRAVQRERLAALKRDLDRRRQV